jgi:hypothetical protein
MSQRLGAADGRAFTISTSSKLFDNYLMNSHKVPLVDNYAYRRLLQAKGPAMVKKVQDLQQVGQRPGPHDVNQCMTSDRPLLKVPGIY